MPSFTSGPVKARNSSASEVSKVGPALRSQLFRAYLVQRIAVWRALREPHRGLERRCVELGVVDRKRHQADALGFLAGQGFAQQQIVFGLGHAAQQRPDDRRMIAGGDAELGVAVDQLGGLGRDRNVGQHADHQARAHGGAADGADDRLAAIDHVVDEIARLLPTLAALLEVVGEIAGHVEVAARRERAAGAGDDDGRSVGVAVDVAPDFGKFRVRRLIDGVEPLRAVHGDPEHARMRAVEEHVAVTVVAAAHRIFSTRSFTPACSPPARSGIRPAW